MSVTPIMSTFMIEPGAKLANRYRLDEVVSETGGATRWKATDETLARLVAVWTFAEGFPRTSEVVRAARATSRIADARVTQVFDADDSSAVPYVVEEWVVGQSLTDLLSQGPLDPERAAGLVAEAAEAIAAANAGGLYHLCLSPNKLMWSAGGAVKVTGIGVDAALRGVSSPHPAAADAQGLGRLLYAALTAHWPEGPQSGLNGAPTTAAGPCLPKQLRAGVPEQLNTITVRAALPHLAGHLVPGPALATAADVVAALAEVPRLIPLPVNPVESTPPPEPGTSRRTGEFGATGTGPRASSRAAARQEAPPRAASRTARRAAAQRERGSMSQLVIGAVALVVFTAVVIGAWIIGSSMRPPADAEGGNGQDQADSATGNGEEAVELVPLIPEGATGFDPLGDGEEHNDRAPLAIDGDTSTEWRTQGYLDGPDRWKGGVGLRIDMGESVELHQIDLHLGSGTHILEIRVGDDSDISNAVLEGMTKAWAGSASDENEIALDAPVTGRYVLVWFTELPPDDGGYRGTVKEVELHGST